MQEQFEQIKHLLDMHKISYEVSEHEPVYTSEDAARVRKEDVKTGAKALIFVKSKAFQNLEEDSLLHRFRAGGNFILCIISGDRKIDTKKLRDITNCKDVRMATPEEVLECTGCEIGSVHPVGTLMKVSKIYADKRLFDNEYLNFNAGLHTASIRMKSKDFLSLIRPEVVDYAK